MNNYNILVADSGETSRKKICSLLSKKGYKIYQATDGAGTIRLARTTFPNLVIIDENIWGIKAYDVARVIEEDGLSTVIFITKSPNQRFFERLKTMSVYAYINKPINVDQLYQIVEFTIMNSNKINKLEKKVKKLEDTIEGRKQVDKAKRLLMQKHNILEDEAYKLLRKMSMDECSSIGKIAEEVIHKYS